jgi:hypothetical protein
MAEMALVMVAALILILGMVQFALAYWYQHNLLVAVEHAGRSAMINNAMPSLSVNAAQYVCNLLDPGGTSCINVAGGGSCAFSPGQYCANAVTIPSGGGTQIMSLTASYGFSFINVTGGGFTLTAQTTVPLD